MIKFGAIVISLFLILTSIVKAEKYDFENYTSDSELQSEWLINETSNGRSVTLGNENANKYLQLSYNGDTKVEFSAIAKDWSNFKLIKMHFGFPDLTIAKTENLKTLFIEVTDVNNISVKINYPFRHKYWAAIGFTNNKDWRLNNDKGWYKWCINLLDFEDQGLDLSQISKVEWGISSGTGIINMDDISLENPEHVLEFKRLIKSDHLTEIQAEMPYKEDMNRGSYWGVTTLKDNGKYYTYNAWWPKNSNWATGGVDLFISETPTTNFGMQHIWEEETFAPDNAPWSKFIHNPELFKDDDGKFYFYFLGGEGEEWREVGVAYSDNVDGPWTQLDNSILNPNDHGIPPNDATFNGWWSRGVSNPRMIKKDGTYYLFYKTLCKKQGTTNEGFYLGYCLATAQSPTGPFTTVEMNGLNGRGANMEARNVEDACFFKYIDGRYYGILKDFSGYWSVSDKENCLNMFVSDDLINWESADFPWVLDPIRLITWENEYGQYNKAERPYVFWEEDFSQGYLSVAVNNSYNPESGRWWKPLVFPIAQDGISVIPSITGQKVTLITFEDVKYDPIYNKYSLPVSWNNSIVSEEEISFIVEQKVEDGDWEEVLTDYTSYSAEFPIESGNNYFYRVTAKANGELSNISNEAMYDFGGNTSVEEDILNRVSIYPNPVTNVLNIDNIHSEGATFNMYNIKGSKVMARQLVDSRNSIIVDSLPKGLYTVQIVFQGVAKTIKVLKQ